jgi:hypothetical protein
MYTEGSATGDLEIGFLCLKENADMAPKFQVATTSFSCSSADIN